MPTVDKGNKGEMIMKHDAECVQMAERSKQLVRQIHEAESQGRSIDGLVKEHIRLLEDFHNVFLRKSGYLPPLDRVSGEIQIVSNLKAWSKKIGLPTEEYDKQIFELRCRIFAPEAVKKLFKDED